MPAIALDWSHRLMRLMLKYQNVVGLGDTAHELLDFAKRTRALEALLHDATRSSVVLVSLDEPVVRAETERLAAEITARGIDIAALVWNRVRSEPSPLPASAVARQFCASEMIPPPIGAPALREWSTSWHELSLNS
jgi:anion-transporting  ArsA/GET3 family ATPase